MERAVLQDDEVAGLDAGGQELDHAVNGTLALEGLGNLHRFPLRF